VSVQAHPDVGVADTNLNANVATMFAARAALHSERVALIDCHRGRDRATTFGELDDRGARIATLLREVGVTRGDVVLLGEPPGRELYATVLAILRLGAVAMIVEPGSGRLGIAAACALTTPRALFAPARTLALALAITRVRRIPVRITSSRWFPTATSIHLASDRAPDRNVECVSPDAPAILTFTSGSTGAPKGAIRTHALLAAQQQALRSVAAHDADIDLVSLPIVVLANLVAGATSVLAEVDARRPDTAALQGMRDQIARLSPTRLTVPPILVERLAREGGVLALGRLRRIVTGGGPVFPDVVELVREVAPGVELVSVYGSTEAEPIAHVSAASIGETEYQGMQNGAGLLAGSPVVQAAVRILSTPEEPLSSTLSRSELDSRTAAAGEPGEIIVSGAHVVAGYVDGRGDSETKVRVDGQVWHRTGDAGYFDREGRLWLLGRTSATVRDARGVVYPFAVECAARSTIGRRVALAAIDGRRVLVIEGTLTPDEQARLRDRLSWASLNDLVCVARLTMDRRHASKVDYAHLRALLARHARGARPFSAVMR
jgi:acyl-CoA synthetase (AMP-forming)/AMP-acid ligase II